jgi:hypothetical protein
LIFALGQAGYDINNSLYKQISEVLFPLKDEQIYKFISGCIEENKDKLLSIGDSNMEQKKEEIKTCVKTKIKESFPNMDPNIMDNIIMQKINASIDMLENESLKGGRRRKRKTRKHTNSKKHKKPKKTRKKKIAKKQ